MRRDGKATPVEYRTSVNKASIRCHQNWKLIRDDVERRAVALESEGLKQLDALHVACSERASCEFFLTCDDRLIRRYAGSLRVISPVTFILEVTGDEQ
mgnify:CR=1 FL=1